MKLQFYFQKAIVAPLVGAWIEIFSLVYEIKIVSLSLLSWERGLKYISNISNQSVEMSLLSWERGLKFRYETLVF